MLTDIFAYRYRDLPIWDDYTEEAHRLMHQSIGILKDVFPYYNSEGKEIDRFIKERLSLIELSNKGARQASI